MSSRRFLVTRLFLFVALGSAAHADEISIGGELREAFNDATSNSWIRAALDLPSYWDVASITVDTAELRVMPEIIGLPELGPEELLSEEIRRDNCTAEDATFSDQVTLDVVHSITNTKSHHFGTGLSAKVTWAVEAGVELKAFKFGTSVEKEVGISFDYDYTTESAETRTTVTSRTFTDTIVLPARSITVIGEWGEPSRGLVQYELEFEPSDDTIFEVTFRDTSRACVYEHNDWAGISYCTLNSSHVLPDLNDKVSSIVVGGELRVTMFQDIFWEGPSQTYTASRTSLGPTWNDQFSSLRIERGTVTRTISWEDLRDILTWIRRPTTFGVRGTLDVNTVDKRRLRIHQAVGEDNDVYRKYCSALPDFQTDESGRVGESERQYLRRMIGEGKLQEVVLGGAPQAPSIVDF